MPQLTLKRSYHQWLPAGPVLRFRMPMTKGKKNVHYYANEKQFKGVWNLVKLNNSNRQFKHNANKYIIQQSNLEDRKNTPAVVTGRFILG